MIPWQIYADYLEDRGIDTKLFRIAERKISFVVGDYPIILNQEIIENGDGIGVPAGRIHRIGDGFGIGCGYPNGDGEYEHDDDEL